MNVTGGLRWNTLKNLKLTFNYYIRDLGLLCVELTYANSNVYSVATLTFVVVFLKMCFSYRSCFKGKSMKHAVNIAILAKKQKIIQNTI